jgi:hypothetical protein
MIHVSSSAQLQLQEWLQLRLYSFFKKNIEKYLLSDFRQADAGIPIALQPVSNKSASAVASRHLGETRASELNVLCGAGGRGWPE